MNPLFRALYEKLGALAVDIPRGNKWCPMVLLSDIKELLEGKED